jgi:Putative Ig domain
MAAFPCPTRGSTVVDPSNPVANISSETPDEDVYIGLFFGDPTPPRLGPWQARWCLGIAESTESQEAADLLAAQLSANCTWDNDNPVQPQWQPNPNSNPKPGDPAYIPGPWTMYENDEQSCDYTCPDGSIYIYTAPAGLFTALSKAAANSKAATWACQKAIELRICIGDLSDNSICLGTDYEATITFTMENPPALVTMVSGSLPPGVSYTYDDDKITLSGLVGAVGAYVFTFQVEDVDGNFNNKQFTIYVATIANATLTDASYGAPYSETLASTGATVGAKTWSVVSGALPAGLTLDPATGEISGTPSADGVYSFTVQMEDEG